jgi:Peptidase family M23/Kelch motif
MDFFPLSRFWVPACVVVASLSASPGWSADVYLAHPMASGRTGHSSTLLTNGEVLIAGGSLVRNTSPTATAEIFDPLRGSFRPTTSMNLPRASHSAVRLADGKVLVVGGFIQSFTNPTRTAEIFDPVSETWTTIGSMTVARADEPAILPGCQPDHFLVIGGTMEGNFGTATARIDRYDPVSRTFSHIADLVRSRRDFAATTLPDGRILVAGGQFSCCNTAENNLRRQSAEILGACGTGARLLGASLVHPRSRRPLAHLLDNGKVLIGGGGLGVPVPLEFFLPATESFAVSSAEVVLAQVPRFEELSDGRILMSGLLPAVSAGAVYDPAADSVEPVGAGLELSEGHDAAPLADGRVLLSGGGADPANLSQAWIFDPAYVPGAFLERFPIESVATGPRTALVAGVLDHHVPATGVPATWLFGYTCTSSANPVALPCGDGQGHRQVRAFDGQFGDAEYGQNAAPPGYRASCDGPPYGFPQFVYQGTGGGGTGTCPGGPGGLGPTSYLDYDGHPGYDFPYPSGEWIVAAAGGVLERHPSDRINHPSTWNSGNENLSQFNALRIRHPNGLETWYLHGIAGSECVVPGLCTNGSAPVLAGQRIARVGNTGAAGVHLHFEVRRSADQQPVDPFGCVDSVRATDPAACLPGGSLWLDLLFADGFESGDLAAWTVP